ncbi:MAG: hypothetical protein M1453_00735 [Acidobacteria bacterium]|nr:hypothetical protein [Acidobacteriota bacterium]
MAEVRCAKCNADALEAYWRLDDSMAVHCKKCEKSFRATQMKGCPQCGSHNLRMILAGNQTTQRCEACGSTFEMAALGDCPHCNSAELQFITQVGNVVVTCKQCGRTGTREEMMRVVTVEPTETAGSGCFIATAACGTDQAPEVVELRMFREKVLRQTRTGRAMIAVYETVSPPLARVIRCSETLRWLVRVGVVRPAGAAARKIEKRKTYGTTDKHR